MLCYVMYHAWLAQLAPAAAAASSCARRIAAARANSFLRCEQSFSVSSAFKKNIAKKGMTCTAASGVRPWTFLATD